jgi:alpha-amylase/alpha-mannosidase (GH57 family)
MEGLPAISKPKRYVVIHGHFYQPPRENPWIEQIEVEAGAHPYHDWNARITAECYGPNAAARIVDSQRRILDVVNNYEHISFNFGPTLISWLEDKAPQAYQRILEADRRSQARLGHGNALAQAYNHAILPLLTARDRETQVIWGLKDFSRRFGRPAAAMWLPETAVNYPTLATLVEHGMKFVILSPYQAKRVRPLKGVKDWQPVQAHTLDTTQAYRCFIPDGKGEVSLRRHIDVFFYNGAVAADISFGDLLKDSNQLAARLTENLTPGLARPQLCHVATDGENYGHHKKFGELALAHMVAQALPQRGLALTNYAAFLELAPAQMEVELYLGPEGEGSSWSCAHGVGRWKENCGCATGGPPTWNQRWRVPLKEAFDFLNGKLAEVFEAEGQKYFQDPWAARDAYIEVILDRSPGAVTEWFSREARPGLREGDRVTALKLLEMERHALLMYTSCGWFFADLAGLETLQVLKYAARALQLGQHFTSDPLEPPFLQILERAVSNVSEAGNGKSIYQRRIKPLIVDFPKVANQWVISWLKTRERQCPARIYHYQAEPLEFEDKTKGSLEFAAGRLRLTSGITRERRELAFFTVYLGSYLYRTQVQAHLSAPDFRALKQELFAILEKTPEDLIPQIARRLGEKYYTVHDMFLEEKHEVFEDLLVHYRDEALAAITHNFDDALPLLRAMAAEGLPLPRLYRALGEITLNRRLVELLRHLEPEPSLLPASGEILELVKTAELLGLQLESGEGAQILTRILHRHLEDLASRVQTDKVGNLRDFLNLASRIPITLDFTEAQNFLFELMSKNFPAVAARAARDPKALALATQLVELVEALNFSPVRYMRLLG